VQFILNRERESLKSRDRRFQPDMFADLPDKMIIPMPAKACDQTMR
jgi:hypothetical protein